MRVTLTPGAFDAEGRHRLAAALTEATCRAESVPDRPGPRQRALILFEEMAPGSFYSAGRPADEVVCGVFMRWQVSAGVLDGARKAFFADALQRAAEGAAQAGEGRLVVTSCVIEEVPEGQWAQNGRIRRLPEIAGSAEFVHLESMARPAPTQ